MRFDGNVFYHLLERYPPDVLMEEWREEATLFDQAGFTTIWIGEQHFWIAAPNPILINTHLATHTKRLRVGQSACVLPDWHPIRSPRTWPPGQHDPRQAGRRHRTGVKHTGRYHLQRRRRRRDQARNYALFSETLDVLIKAWTEDAFVHEGRFYNFPPTGWKEEGLRIYSDNPAHYSPDGEIIALPVRPQALPETPTLRSGRPPTPPLHTPSPPSEATPPPVLAVPSKASGRLGQPIEIRHPGSGVGDVPLGRSADGKTLNVMRTCYVAETQEQAEKEAREGINRWYDVTTGLNPSRGKQSCVASWEELKDRDLNAEWFDFLQEKEIIWVGSPEYVAERIDHLRTEL